jgi:2,4-dienoyl-CoA reductase-like NADH-dependent reductase (Old Yellow Enzyme family)
MCQYSSVDGYPNEWHLVHLGSRAIGGTALVMTEATAISPEGRISPADTGIWSDAHAEAWKPIAAFVRKHGAVAGMQLAHAGRKASTDVPWRGGKAVGENDGGWVPVAPSAISFRPIDPVPHALETREIEALVDSFAVGALRALAAGFQLVEIHSAHGYLLHEFLSPLSNHRKDEFGGSLENRMRVPLRVVEAVRAVWPKELPLFVRISSTDWVEGGWDLAQSVAFAKELKKLGVDLVDCSSGGMVPTAVVPAEPGYQVPFARAIRRDAQIPTGAVGLITEAHRAEQIIATGDADAVFLARQLLRDPYWPLHAAKQLGADVVWPEQYLRAK